MKFLFFNGIDQIVIDINLLVWFMVSIYKDKGNRKGKPQAIGVRKVTVLLRISAGVTYSGIDFIEGWTAECIFN